MRGAELRKLLLFYSPPLCPFEEMKRKAVSKDERRGRQGQRGKEQCMLKRGAEKKEKEEADKKEVRQEQSRRKGGVWSRVER